MENCPICNKGIEPKQYIHLPVKENGVIVSYLRLTLNGKLHKQILKQAGGKLPVYVVKI